MHFAFGVAVYLLRALVPADYVALEGFSDDTVDRCIDDCRQLEGGFFHGLAFADIFDSQENHLKLFRRIGDPPRTEEHRAFADADKIMFDFIIVESCFHREDGFQQLLQFRDVPLFIAKVVDEMPDCLGGFYPENLIERAAGRNHPQIFIQDD